MILRNLMICLLTLTLMVFVGGCDSELDETSNLAVITTEFDLDPYCGEGTQPNADQSQCIPATFLDGCLAGGGSIEDGICIAAANVSCGEGTELNNDGTQCVPVYDCFRGGFCSKAAALFGDQPWPYANIYAEHVFDDARCGGSTDWDSGIAIASALQGSPCAPCYAVYYLCR